MDRRQAFKLVMLALDYCDKEYQAHVATERRLDESRLRSFLDERSRFLGMIRYGIERRPEAPDAD